MFKVVNIIANNEKKKLLFIEGTEINPSNRQNKQNTSGMYHIQRKYYHFHRQTTNRMSVPEIDLELDTHGLTVEGATHCADVGQRRRLCGDLGRHVHAHVVGK